MQVRATEKMEGLVVNCVHHWMIEAAELGRPSPGTCKKCGAGREFLNYIDEREGAEDTSAGRIAQNKARRQLHLQKKDAYPRSEYRSRMTSDDARI
jgi:hypothetical protein